MEKHASKRDLAIIKVILNTGLRVNELCELRWSEIILSERKGNLSVRRGKGNKHREVPLNKDARNAFFSIDYKKQVGSNAPIFIGQRGPIKASSIENQIFIMLLNCSIFNLLAFLIKLIQTEQEIIINLRF